MSRRGTRLHASADLRDLIASRIKEAQIARGILTEDLSRQTGISLRLVQKHRAGHNAPNFDNLSKYARVLKKPVSWFLEGKKRAAA